MTGGEKPLEQLTFVLLPPPEQSVLPPPPDEQPEVDPPPEQSVPPDEQSELVLPPLPQDGEPPVQFSLNSGKVMLAHPNNAISPFPINILKIAKPVKAPSVA